MDSGEKIFRLLLPVAVLREVTGTIEKNQSLQRYATVVYQDAGWLVLFCFLERSRVNLFQRLISVCSHSPARFRVGALGFNRAGVIVAVGFSRPRFNRSGGGVHAEETIMRVARKRGVVKILIGRIGRSGLFRPIDPCPRCLKHAQRLGIKIESVK